MLLIILSLVFYHYHVAVIVSCTFSCLCGYTKTPTILHGAAALMRYSFAIVADHHLL